MQVKSFGCSFTFGTDIPDTIHYKSDKHYGPYIKPSQKTWPALIAHRLNTGYFCHALAGIGNLRIMESVLSQSVKPEKTLFVINWTYIDRFDYIDANNQWQTILPGTECPSAKSYYADLHSTLKDKLMSLMYIKLTAEELNRRGHAFIMTCIDDLLLDQKWDTDPAIISLQEQVSPYIKDFQGLNFLQWCRDRHLPISDTDHPLEEAHLMAADYVWNNLADFTHNHSLV